MTACGITGSAGEQAVLALQPCGALVAEKALGADAEDPDDKFAGDGSSSVTPA